MIIPATDCPTLTGLSDYVAGPLFSLDPFGEYCRPVFNAYRFPIAYSVAPGYDPDAVLRQLFVIRDLLPLAEVINYHGWLQQEGIAPRLPAQLTGICTHDRATCKVMPDKFTCGGCGRTIVPGSLQDKACKVHANPWWMKYIGPDMESLVDEHGGVSKTDPLILFPAGAFRHGRKIHYDQA